MKTALEIINELSAVYVSATENQFEELASCPNYILTAEIAIKAMKIYANQKLDEAADCYEYDINEEKFILNKKAILNLKDEL